MCDVYMAPLRFVTHEGQCLACADGSSSLKRLPIGKGELLKSGHDIALVADWGDRSSGSRKLLNG